jgi:hypothetical protein
VVEEPEPEVRHPHLVGVREGEGEAEADIPPPPVSWSKEDAAGWAELTPGARDTVLRREAERERYVADVGRKSAEEREATRNEAMHALAEQADQHARELAAYMGQNMPAPPDPRLLYTNDPNDVLAYQRQDAAYRAAAAQQQELQQAIAQYQQQAEAVRSHARSAELAQEGQRLRETIPELFDPAKGPELRNTLESTGRDLGYSPELMAQAGANDFMALKLASEWRAKAAKYDKLVAKRMEVVRGAKNVPRVTRPGAAPTQRATSQAAQDRAWQDVKSSRSPEAMADWLESSGIRL